MKVFPRPFPRVLCLMVLGLWLTGSTPVFAQSSHRHSRHQPTDDDDATPTPSPSPKGKTRHPKGADQKPADAAALSTPATPATKNANSDDLSGDKSPGVKPTSADEVAPSKAPGDASNPAKNLAGSAAVSSLDPSEIEGFDAYPEPIRKLLTAALDLTRQNLTYAFGSSDPKNGGMDCSGTIYYLLNQAGFTNVPRQANEQYDWVRQKSRFYAVLSKKQDNFELKEMRPGDLLFWTGTYRVDRDPPVTHTMIYLGKRKRDGQRIMFGASDGRPYNGERRNGVSVFDFKMPAARSGDAADAATAATPAAAPDFSGYGPVPGMPDLADAALRQTTAAKGSTADNAPTQTEDSSSASPTPKPKRTRSGSHHSND